MKGGGPAPGKKLGAEPPTKKKIIYSNKVLELFQLSPVGGNPLHAGALGPLDWLSRLFLPSGSGEASLGIHGTLETVRGVRRRISVAFARSRRRD